VTRISGAGWRFGLATALALVVAPPAVAQQQLAISDLDRVHPELGRQGMVASQEADATRIGLEVLQNGGNAVDAAATIAFVLAVTLPQAGNLGGGGFMVVYDADSGETAAIDYREMSGAAAFRDMYLDEQGEADPEKSRYSGLAVGVPGTVAGMALALEQFGTISLAEALAPAIALAERGITVSPDLAQSLEGAAERLQKWPASAEVFYKDGGETYRPGETLVQADLADSMKLIAADGASALYGGPIGEKIVAEVARAGGHLTMDDFAAYQAVLR
jgi:gamma-glutamyltranspeptidase/glutathione hydrolase